MKKLKEKGESEIIHTSQNQQEQVAKNQTSVFNKILGGTYFGSEWSFAQFRLDSPRSICTFGSNNTLIVISSSGKYYQASFDPKKKGECTLLQENSLNIGERGDI